MSIDLKGKTLPLQNTGHHMREHHALDRETKTQTICLLLRQLAKEQHVPDRETKTQTIYLLTKENLQRSSMYLRKKKIRDLYP